MAPPSTPHQPPSLMGVARISPFKTFERKKNFFCFFSSFEETLALRDGIDDCKQLEGIGHEHAD